MTVYILILLLISGVIFGFLKMKFGNYINGKLAMKNDFQKAVILFEQSIKDYNLIDKSYFQLGVCYENIAIENNKNRNLSISKAFINYFNAIYFSKENENFELLEKAKYNIQQLYYSFNQEEKEKNLNNIFSVYNSKQ